MERLTEEYKYTTGTIVHERKYANITNQQLIDKLAEYEIAEEQGLLLRLPVPIGTTVYVIESECEGDPYDCHHGCEHCACLNTFVAEVKFDAEWFDCIGNTVFLTRELAEEALNEQKKL